MALRRPRLTRGRLHKVAIRGLRSTRLITFGRRSLVSGRCRFTVLSCKSLSDSPEPAAFTVTEHSTAFRPEQQVQLRIRRLWRARARRHRVALDSAGQQDSRAGLRPRTSGPKLPPFDHTSIIRTVREIFGLGGKLTDRDDVAPSLVPYLSLLAPKNDGPPSVTAALDEPSWQLVAKRGTAGPNDMQAALAAAAASLPESTPTLESQIPASATVDRPPFLTVAAAQVAAVACTKAFLGLLTSPHAARA